MRSLAQTFSLAPTASHISHPSFPQETSSPELLLLCVASEAQVPALTQTLPWVSALPLIIYTCLGNSLQTKSDCHLLKSLKTQGLSLSCICSMAFIASEIWNNKLILYCYSLGSLKSQSPGVARGTCFLLALFRQWEKPAAVFGTHWSFCRDTRNCSNSKWKGQYMGHSGHTLASGRVGLQDGKYSLVHWSWMNFCTRTIRAGQASPWTEEYQSLSQPLDKQDLCALCKRTEAERMLAGLGFQSKSSCQFLSRCEFPKGSPVSGCMAH